MIGERAVDTVVLMNADLPSVVAISAVREEIAVFGRQVEESGRRGTPPTHARVAVMEFLSGRGEGGVAVHAAVRRIAEVHGVPFMELKQADSGSVDRGEESESMGLIAAAYAAAYAGYPRIVWPASAGIGGEVDIGRAAAILDRSTLCGRVVAIDSAAHGCPGIHIETPYADLSDTQIADLALDLAVPLEACWWWDEGGEPNAAAGLARERWMPRLVEMGYRAR